MLTCRTISPSRFLLTHSTKFTFRSMSSSQFFTLDPFAFRHWDGTSPSQSKISKTEFLEKLHESFKQQNQTLHDGYAPFCKHVFVENFCGMPQTSLKITDDNRKYLKCDYEARREDELPVLTRWFDKNDVEVREAKYLDVILYSRDQINKENEAMGHEEDHSDDHIPWGVISIKAQDENHETPMQPITMMRNALGREEGGSGVPLDKEKYRESVAYWKEHATVQ